MCVVGGSGDVSLEFEGEASEEPLAVWKVFPARG